MNGLPMTVWMLCFVSLFSDLSSEMNSGIFLPDRSRAVVAGGSLCVPGCSDCVFDFAEGSENGEGGVAAGDLILIPRVG